MPTKPVDFIKTVSASDAPEALRSVQTIFREATIIGKRAPRVNNTGRVYLGVTSGNNTQSFPIGSGETVTLTAPGSLQYDFRDWFLDVDDNGDGVYVLFR